MCVQWVPEITHYCQRTPFIIVGTRIEQRDDPETIKELAKKGKTPITYEMGEQLAKELKAVKYMECSALTQVSHTRLIINSTCLMLLSTQF